MELNLREILYGIRRWWWLLLLGPLLMTALAYLYSSRQTPLYQAQVTLQVDPPQDADIGDYTALLYAQLQAQTYQQFVTVSSVLESVIAELGLPETVNELRANVAAQAVGDSQILFVRVSDPDPARAATIANSLAVNFSSFVARNETPPDGAAEPGRTPVRISVIEPAVPPSTPYTPRTTLTMMLGFIAGGILAGGLVLLLIYVDRTVKTHTDFSLLGAGPMLAAITAIPKGASGRRRLFVLEQPAGEAAEAVRLLRANVELTSADREIATLAISSVDHRGGKSTVAANLAVTLAQAGYTVALVDADLHTPSIHTLFDLPNERGLSAILTQTDLSWRWAAMETMVHNLVVIPSGLLPPNPADLLSRERFRAILRELKHTFGVIVLETPPILGGSDALVVASQVDAVVLVCRAGKTRIEALRRAAAALRRGAVRLIGVTVTHENGHRAARLLRWRRAPAPAVPAGLSVVTPPPAIAREAAAPPVTSTGGRVVSAVAASGTGVVDRASRLWSTVVTNRSIIPSRERAAPPAEREQPTRR